MGSGYGSPGDRGPCGYRWGKMMGRRWCTFTKSRTCGWDMRMVGAERGGGVGEAGERQAKAQVLTARKVGPKQAVLWMQMQRDAQVAACVDSTSRTVEVWGPTRQVLALALYVGETVRRSRGMAGEWDSDTQMNSMRNVMAMIDYDGAAVRRAKGHTIQVVSPQASATGAADQGSLTWCRTGTRGGSWNPEGVGAKWWCIRRHL